jgi:hypothetical protein
MRTIHKWLAPMRRVGCGLASARFACAAGLLLTLSPSVALAQGSSSTTTTTTLPVMPTSTTLDTGIDVNGGARVRGGFGPFGFDLYYFDVTTPIVLLTETSNGSDSCNTDTTMQLTLDGQQLEFDDESGPGQCSRIERLLTEPGTYYIKVAGYLNNAVREYVIDVELVETECGNGSTEPLEECDDGNLEDGDCCTADCTIEVDGSPCDNGKLCDGTDSCADGYCTVHAMNPCTGEDGDGNCGESCSDTAAGCFHSDSDGSPCNDGLFCNGADECFQGLCSIHEGDPCRGPDLDGICNESCKESSDSCSAADPSQTSCDDGSFCNGEDTCVGGVCSVHTGNPCTGPDGDGDCSESCSEPNQNCNGADPFGSACTDGLFCTGTDKCSGGTCSVHTGSPCPGPDGDGNCKESCNEAVDNCTADDPLNSTCNDGTFCNGNDRCSSGLCALHVGNPCPGPDGDANCAESCNEAADACTAADPNASACVDGLFCNGADTCASGVCSGHAGNPCPGPDGDGNCSESCNETVDACTAADPNGSACNDGLFCTGTDTCSAGACSVHAGTTCPGADGDGNCSESCNEAADACTAADSNGVPCNDGVFCNGADTCSGGTCSAHAGSPCPGADGDGNCSESCDETLDTCTAPDTNGSTCTDGLFCNGADTCAAGACTGHAGNPCPGADGDGNCSESCNEIGDVCTAADPNGSACTDGLFCNGTDTCSGGACAAHSGDPCPGPDGDAGCAESCNEATDACTLADPNGSACNDGVFCNGADACSGGSCAGHAGDPCPGPDGDDDCTEACNEAADACTLADTNGSACNDALFCNGADTCSGGNCTVHAGNPCTGADGDGNCSESCKESDDSCTAPDTNGSTCNDGLVCNGADTCSGGFCTVHEGITCPGADGDADCSESCSDTSGGCTGNDPAGSPCNDGIFCNGADTCSNGSCSVHAGNPCPGPDGDGNCSESCNEGTDTCTAPDAGGSACDDGLFCNGADSCASGVCTTHAGDPCPGPDGDADCSEECDEGANACSALDDNGSACDDGVFCNGDDACSAGACSSHEGNPCPGPDGDGDCSEACDETTNDCSASDPGGSTCDDGLFCNGGDACSQGACSAHEGDPCTGADGDADCAESCNEGANDCTGPDADESACDDGLFCNGIDSCEGGACAAHRAEPCDGPDADADCIESCDETTDACDAADPDESGCNDGLFCNGLDFCSAGACIGHAGDPCPGPDGDEDCSESCDDGANACTAADADGTECDDSDACTLEDVCDGAGECLSSEPIVCDDEDECTLDECTATEPFCSHTDLPNCPPSTTTTTVPDGTCGDANGNGDVTAGDALLVLRSAVGGPECSARVCLCDVNSAGGITAVDALLALRFAVGQPVELDCDCQ